MKKKVVNKKTLPKSAKKPLKQATRDQHTVVLESLYV